MSRVSHTRHEVEQSSQSEQYFGANPLDRAELDISSISWKVDVEHGQFLTRQLRQSIPALYLPPTCSSSQTRYCLAVSTQPFIPRKQLTSTESRPSSSTPPSNNKPK